MDRLVVGIYVKERWREDASLREAVPLGAPSAALATQGDKESAVEQNRLDDHAELVVFCNLINFVLDVFGHV